MDTTSVCGEHCAGRVWDPFLGRNALEKGWSLTHSVGKLDTLPSKQGGTGYYAGDMQSSNVLTYSRSRGLFAVVSLEGASIDGSGQEANKKLYGEELGAKEIVTNAQPFVPAVEPQVSLLDATSPGRQ